MDEMGQSESSLLNKSKLKLIKSKIPSDEQLYDLSELFKVFGDSTRVEILCTLTISPLCVGDISELLNLSISAVSHQLRILKQARLVKSHRIGKNVCYSVCDHHIATIFELGLTHIKE